MPACGAPGLFRHGGRPQIDLTGVIPQVSNGLLLHGQPVGWIVGEVLLLGPGPGSEAQGGDGVGVAFVSFSLALTVDRPIDSARRIVGQGDISPIYKIGAGNGLVDKNILADLLLGGEGLRSAGGEDEQ